MFLLEAIERLTNEKQGESDNPDPMERAAAWLNSREQLLQHTRQCWLDGLIVIRGREYPWYDKTGTPGPSREIEAHDDMHFAYEGREVDLLHLYRRPSKGRGRLGHPDAEWRELTISQKDFEKLRAAIRQLSSSPQLRPDKRRPGPKPTLLNAITDKMLDDLRSKRETPKGLENLKLEALSAHYGESKNTADKARKQALNRPSEFQNSNSEKL